MNSITISFNDPVDFSLENIKPLMGICGLYLIFNEKMLVQYPFACSYLIYIGMSEKKTNSIGMRLSNHFEGKSNNFGLMNYNKVNNLKFTYLNFEIFKNIWKYRIEDFESYFINDFVKNYGVYPICNNKTGFEVMKIKQDINIIIDWKYFEEG